jgi:hypothetical protein
LTLKGLETDTLYLVFKHRFQIVIWIALQTILTRRKQTGILTNDLDSVKRPSRVLRFIRRIKSVAISLQILQEKRH